MRRHSSVEPRRVIFIGVEGESDELRRRFSLSDLRRAARYDKELRRLLAVLGL